MPLILGLRFPFNYLQRHEEVKEVRSLDCEHPRADPSHNYCPICGRQFGLTQTVSETRIIIRKGFSESANLTKWHPAYLFQWKEKQYPVCSNVRKYTHNYDYFLIIAEGKEGMLDLRDMPSREELEELLNATGAIEYGIYELGCDL